MVKVIGNYLLRVLIFLIIVGLTLNNVLDFEAVIFTKIGHLIEPFIPKEAPPAIENIMLLLAIIYGLCVTLTVFVLNIYYYVKITGIFKKPDPLKKWQTFLIILVFSILCDKISDYEELENVISYNILDMYDIISYTLIPAYFLYLLLNHLTRKYPKYFEKIRYYSSIDFFKDLAVKIYKKVKKEEI